METRLAKLCYFEAAEFENDTEISSLALVFELQLWPEISIFFQLNIMSPFSKVGNTLSGRRNSYNAMKSRYRLSSLQVFVHVLSKIVACQLSSFLIKRCMKAVVLQMVSPNSFIRIVS